MIFPALLLSACKAREPQIYTPEGYNYNLQAEGPELEIIFRRGNTHNHPLMAIWVEDLEGNYIQTLFVAKSIGTGVFEHGRASHGKWLPGEVRRPAALPVWSHKRGIRAADNLFVPDSLNPISDAYTGATPTGDFNMIVKLDNPTLRKFNLFFEINQSWDWNQYWTNNKYPDDTDYKSSSQPSLIYKTTVNMDSEVKKYSMELIGHGHYSGKNGDIYENLNSITTAREITASIDILVKSN